jgi:hypothetical protein
MSGSFFRMECLLLLQEGADVLGLFLDAQDVEDAPLTTSIYLFIAASSHLQRSVTGKYRM